MNVTDTLVNKTNVFILQVSLPPGQEDQPKIYTHISCDGDKDVYTNQKKQQ